MRRILAAALIVVPFAIAAPAASTSRAPVAPTGQARPTSNAPIFTNDVGPTLATLATGTKIQTYSFCAPAPKPGHFCGGPLVKNQRNPIGPLHANTTPFTMGKGPYTFLVRKGFLPLGLVLHTNGLLTGTVAKYAPARRWSFSVCVSAATIAPNVGEKDSTCIATSIVITKAGAPAPSSFTGTWRGTFTGTISGGGCPDFPVGGPITFSLTQNGVSLSGTITFTGTSMTWDPSSCVVTSRSDETLAVNAAVNGLTASGGSITLTMSADLRSFAGSWKGSGTNHADFTAQRA